MAPVRLPSRGRAAAVETFVRRTAVIAWHKGKTFGQVVVIGAVGVFASNTKPAIALVKIA